MKKLMLILMLAASMLCLTSCKKAPAVDLSIYTINSNSTLTDTLQRNNIASDELTIAALDTVEGLIQGNFDKVYEMSYQTHSETIDTSCIDASAIERYMLSGDLGDGLYDRNGSKDFILQNTEISGTGTVRTVIVYLLDTATNKIITVNMVMTLSSDNTWLWAGNWATVTKINVPHGYSLTFVQANENIEIGNPSVLGRTKDTYTLYLPIGEILFEVTDGNEYIAKQSIVVAAGVLKTYSLGG